MSSMSRAAWVVTTLRPVVSEMDSNLLVLRTDLARPRIFPSTNQYCLPESGEPISVGLNFISDDSMKSQVRSLSTTWASASITGMGFPP